VNKGNNISEIEYEIIEPKKGGKPGKDDSKKGGKKDTSATK
jgi:hypothetical protein